MVSNHPLREIGTNSEGIAFFTEEDLESHIHILGSTREGKSKLMELLARRTIDRGFGACVIDPSDNGDTAYNILRYAIDVGFEKVILIDPHDINPNDDKSRIPAINPLDYEAPANVAVGNFMDTARVLWNQASFSDTPRIQKYLPALVTALHAGRYCLPDAECLMDRADLSFREDRNRILENPKFKEENRRQYAHLASALGSPYIKANQREYEGYLPTVNRLEPFMDNIMKLIFGSREGMNFQTLLTQGYLILVVLDPEGVWGKDSPEQRLLGTVVINELINAASRVRYHNLKDGKQPWHGPYYVYIDEVGDYATTTLKYILDKKAKSGFRLCLSHQGFDQLPKDVESSVRRGTKIKVLFNTADRADRDTMIRMMFGGALTDREVSFHLMDTPKQNCWIKNNKKTTEKVRILDLPPIPIPSNVFIDFKKTIYASDFYKYVGDIKAETTNRFATRPTNASEPRAKIFKDGPPVDRTTSSPQNRPHHQTPTVPDAPVESGRKRGSVLTSIKRKKGIPSTLVPKHPPDDEPVEG